MNTDERTLFIATPGGKTESIVLAMEAKRISAQQARIDYLKSKGPDILNLWGSDGGIVALVLKEGAKIPVGWRRDAKIHRKHNAPDNGTFIVPDGKNKATYAATKQELRALPELPDWFTFTARIGYGGQFIDMRILLSTYERVNGRLVISIPKRGERSSDEAVKPPFVPPDCAPLKWSEYYAMKETVAEAVK